MSDGEASGLGSTSLAVTGVKSEGEPSISLPGRLTLPGAVGSTVFLAGFVSIFLAGLLSRAFFASASALALSALALSALALSALALSALALSALALSALALSALALSALALAYCALAF